MVDNLLRRSSSPGVRVEKRAWEQFFDMFYGLGFSASGIVLRFVKGRMCSAKRTGGYTIIIFGGMVALSIAVGCGKMKSRLRVPTLGSLVEYDMETRFL